MQLYSVSYSKCSWQLLVVSLKPELSLWIPAILLIAPGVKQCLICHCTCLLVFGPINLSLPFALRWFPRMCSLCGIYPRAALLPQVVLIKENGCLLTMFNLVAQSWCLLNINHPQLGVILLPYLREQSVLPVLTHPSSEAEIGAFAEEAGCFQLPDASQVPCTHLLLIQC